MSQSIHTAAERWRDVPASVFYPGHPSTCVQAYGMDHNSIYNIGTIVNTFFDSISLYKYKTVGIYFTSGYNNFKKNNTISIEMSNFSGDDSLH